MEEKEEQTDVDAADLDLLGQQVRAALLVALVEALSSCASNG